MDEMEQDSPGNTTKHQILTPSERIAELNEIDKSVASLLSSAGQAIQILANTSTVPSEKTTLEAQKAAFTQHSSSYFSILSSIEVRLRRQVYALEEAGLIPAGDDRDAKKARVIEGDEREVVAGGPMDVSWLNARAKDSVGENMERELWEKARRHVEELKLHHSDSKDHQPKQAEEVEMEDQESD